MGPFSCQRVGERIRWLTLIPRFSMALSGHPERMKMRKPSRGRGGAAHAGGARGVTPRSNPFLFRAEQRESDAQPTPHSWEPFEEGRGIFEVPWFRGEASGGDPPWLPPVPPRLRGGTAWGRGAGARAVASSPLSLTLSPKGRGNQILPLTRIARGGGAAQSDAQ
jgi:hypothetical protein